jgi:hypothetical protein
MNNSIFDPTVVFALRRSVIICLTFYFVVGSVFVEIISKCLDQDVQMRVGHPEFWISQNPHHLLHILFWEMYDVGCEPEID